VYRDFEVVVIDNASADDTVDKVKQFFPNVRLVVNDENFGHTKAVNQGFKIVRGKYILLLDSDTEIPSDTIGGMMVFMYSHPDVSLSTPRTLNSDGTIQESARNFPTIMNGLFGRQSLLTQWFPNNYFSRHYLARDYLEAVQPFSVEHISAACMLFPTSLLDEVGGWDEQIPGYWIDADWCMALKKQGNQIYCVPEFKIAHHENYARGKKKSARRIWLFHYGAYQLYNKWYSWGRLDPRSLFAGVMLSIRAALLITSNVISNTLESILKNMGIQGKSR
jgi:GT2 family glycosyltransferase